MAGLQRPKENFLALEKHPEIKEDYELPSYQDILQHFVFYLDLKYSHKDIARMARLKLESIYRKHNIPTILAHSIEKKLHIPYDQYADLKRRSKIRNNAQVVREDKFESNFENLFDVSTVDALNTIQDEDVRAFLMVQRHDGRPGVTPRRGTIRQRITGSTVSPLVGSATLQVVPTCEIDNYDVGMSSCSPSPTSNNEVGGLLDDPDYEDESSQKKKQKKKKEVITPRVVGVLDRYKFRSRGVTHLIVAILLALGLNPKEYNVSAASIRNRRKKIRKHIAYSVKDNFEVSTGAVVHFDGKLMESITGSGKEDRLAIKLTCGKIDQFLGIELFPTCNLYIIISVS